MLPFAAITAMKENPDGHSRLQEQLIADEAQDFFSSGYINFLYRSIVDRFQGLEAPAIAVADIDEIVSGEAQKLFYGVVT